MYCKRQYLRSVKTWKPRDEVRMETIRTNWKLSSEISSKNFDTQILCNHSGSVTLVLIGRTAWPREPLASSTFDIPSSLDSLNQSPFATVDAAGEDLYDRNRKRSKIAPVPFFPPPNSWIAAKDQNTCSMQEVGHRLHVDRIVMIADLSRS
jgi:hypothetical protein